MALIAGPAARASGPLMEPLAADAECDRGLDALKRAPAGGARRAVGLRIAVLAALVLGAALRMHTSSPLWLDEALSANIADLPVPRLLQALRQDGSPPLYYLLLHVWMSVFGPGDAAVRSLSTLAALGCLPTVYLVGRRAAGQAGGIISMLLLAACPFAVRYATETRMYALVMLLSALWLLALQRCNERPSPGRMAAVSFASAALALTHYWTLFLLAAGAVTLAAAAALGHGSDRSPARSLAAMCLGGALVVPWLPTMLFQLRHTGTPWAQPPGADAVPETLRSWTGIHRGTLGEWAVGLALVGAVSWLAVGRPPTHGPTRGNAGTAWLWTRPWALSALAVGTLAAGLAASRVLGSGYAARYSAPAVVPVVLAISLMLCRLPNRSRTGVVAVVAALGLAASASAAHNDHRTQAARTADAIVRGAGSDDLVVYCPDQLGPAVSRLLPADLRQVAYPALGAPQRVNWIDYAQRNEAASPLAAAEAIARSAPAAVWLVMAPGYRTYGTQCERLDSYLALLLGGRTVVQEPDRRFAEQQTLLRYSPGPPRAGQR